MSVFQLIIQNEIGTIIYHLSLPLKAILVFEQRLHSTSHVSNDAQSLPLPTEETDACVKGR